MISRTYDRAAHMPPCHFLLLYLSPPPPPPKPEQRHWHPRVVVSLRTSTSILNNPFIRILPYLTDLDNPGTTVAHTCPVPPPTPGIQAQAQLPLRVSANFSTSILNNSIFPPIRFLATPLYRAIFMPKPENARKSALISIPHVGGIDFKKYSAGKQKRSGPVLFKDYTVL